MLNKIPSKGSLYKIIFKKTFSKYNHKPLANELVINYLSILSDGTIITIQSASLYQWKDLSMTTIINKHKEILDIKNLVEIPNSKSEIIGFSTRNILNIFSLKGCNHLQIFDQHEWEIRTIVPFSNNKIASGSNDHTIKVFDYITGEYLINFLAHSWGVNKIIKINNEYKLASCSIDGIIKVWDLDKEECLRKISDDAGFNDIIESNDNKIISVSDNESIKIWDWTIPQCLYTIKTQNSELIFWIGYGTFATFSDGILEIWDYENKDKILTFENRGQIIKDISLINYTSIDRLTTLSRIYTFWIGEGIIFEAQNSLMN